MDILELKERTDISGDQKLSKAYTDFGLLVKAIRKKQLTPTLVSAVNENIERVNASSLDGEELTKLVKSSQKTMLKQMEKEMKIVPKNHFTKLWMVVGMSAFGLPFGVVFGLSLKNIGLLGLGLPIGMGIGVALGASLDKKAADEGRQLDFDPTF
jgi:hypothetical protein